MRLRVLEAVEPKVSLRSLYPSSEETSPAALKQEVDCQPGEWHLRVDRDHESQANDLH